jgi:hypothetical protein
VVKKRHIIAVILLAGTLSADRAVSSTAQHHRAINETVTQRLATRLSHQFQAQRNATFNLFEMRLHASAPQTPVQPQFETAEPSPLLLSPFQFRLPPPVV